ncbi:MAG: nitroreductase family protein [Tannerellaceae bacterium]|nr:nitroreductase family protein [Tannerellaceae bacterium]
MNQMESNPAIKNILSRKSIRRYTDMPVSEDQIHMLLRAAMAAPSALNLQSWAFIVVTDRLLLNTLSMKLPYAKMVASAPVAIVVCGDLSKAKYGGDYWVQDCSAASQNILLAAKALGLGAVWTSTYPEEDRIITVKQILSLPEYIYPLNVIPIGYPNQEETPKDKFDPENIHYNVW